MKKIHFIMINIVQFILILALLFIPILYLYSPVGNESDVALNDRMIFGFNMLGGLSIKNQNATSALDAYIVLMSSKVVGFVPIIMLLFIFLIDKINKSNSLGKDLINVLASAICFVEVFLYPIIAYSLLANQESIYLEFKTIPSFYILLVLVGLNFIYFLIKFIFVIKKALKEAN